MTFRHFRAFLFRSRHDRGQGQHRLRTDQIAEQIAWWHAFRTICPELRQKPIFAMVGERLGLSRAEVCDALRRIDAEQWKQLRANADALVGVPMWLVAAMPTRFAGRHKVAVMMPGCRLSSDLIRGWYSRSGGDVFSSPQGQASSSKPRSPRRGFSSSLPKSSRNAGG